MPVRRMGVIENIDCQVHNPVRRSLVRKNQIIHRALVELAVEIARRDKVAVIKITLAHTEHIHQNEQTYHKRSGHTAVSGQFRTCPEGFLCFFRNGIAPEQAGASDGDEYYRTPGVCPEKMTAVRLQSLGYHILHTRVRSAYK